MEISYDFHIHSCLSPCGDDEMTPWNLVGMAKVMGLDAIALTDHNTTRNLPQAMAAGEAYGVTVLPGMEVSSKEDVHILGYFPSLEAALAAGDEVYSHLPDIMNKADLFGLGEGKKFILLADYLDISLLRNRITYDMARASGLPNALSCLQADVYINGEYCNYGISEQPVADGDVFKIEYTPA